MFVPGRTPLCSSYTVVAARAGRRRWPRDVRSKDSDIAAFVRYFKDQGYVVSTLRQQFQANGEVAQFTLVAAKRTTKEVSTVKATIENGNTSIQVRTTVLVRP